MKIATVLVKLSREFYNRLLGRVISRGSKLNVADVCHVSFADIIPEDIQIEILSRLSPKSLSRCKCVSKHWNTSLTVKAFWFRHSLSYDNSKLVFVACWSIWARGAVISYDPMTSRKTLPEKRWPKDVRFTNFLSTIGCVYMSNICNDLMCLFDDESSIGLLNIRTGDFIRLPARTTRTVGALSFWYTVGFDPVHKLCKVLSTRITYESKSGKVSATNAAILTVGSNNWKPIAYECLPYFIPVTRNPRYRSTRINCVCLDGVLYWVCENITPGASKLTLVAFDLFHEAFRVYELDVTPIQVVGKFSHYLASLKGCPTLFIWNYKGDEVQELRLFNHTSPNAAWIKRSFTSHLFPGRFPDGLHGITVTATCNYIQYPDSIDSEFVAFVI